MTSALSFSARCYNNCPSYCEKKCCRDARPVNFTVQEYMAQIVSIKTWKDYTKQSEDGGQLFDYLLQKCGTHATQLFGRGHCTASQCAHQYFEHVPEFMDVLFKYVTNDRIFNDILAEHKTDSCSFKDGICDRCALSFVSYTNGLQGVVDNIADAIKYNFHGKQKLFRSEINNFNIVLHQNPIFARCIFLPSNIGFIRSAFRTFFVTFLMKTDLNDLVYGAEAQRVLYNENGNMQLHRTQNTVGHIHCVTEPLNACHGFEYSMCCLANLIDSLVTSMTAHHAYELFVTGAVSLKALHWPFIVNEFLEQYMSLPHIRTLMKRRTKRLQKLAGSCNHKSMAVAVFPGPPLLNKLMYIISGLCRHLSNLCQRMEQSKSRNIDELKVVQKQQKRFNHFMNYGDAKNIQRSLLSEDQRVIWVLAFFESSPDESGTDPLPVFCGYCDQEQRMSASKNNRFKKCSQCRLSYYCSRDCQKRDWTRVHGHKNICCKLRDQLF